MRSRDKAGIPRRGRALALVAVLAAVMVPAAIAWACNPQAYLRLDRTTFGPGDSMSISGAFFKGNASLTITIEGGASTSVTTSANGSFSTTMSAPSTPGSYAISAVGFEPDGSVTNGLPARASFTVAASGQTGQPGSPAQPGTPGSGAAGSPGAAPPSRGRFAEPEVPGSRNFPTPGSRSEGGSSSGGGGGGSTSTGAVNAGAGVIGSSSGPVFAGSVARDERTGAASSARGGAPSERSAGSDIWAGFESAGAPSLAADAGGSAPAGGAGSAFGLGLALLGLGAVALVAGLGVSEARRRRKAAG